MVTLGGLGQRSWRWVLASALAFGPLVGCGEESSDAGGTPASGGSSAVAGAGGQAAGSGGAAGGDAAGAGGAAGAAGSAGSAGAETVRVGFDEQAAQELRDVGLDRYRDQFEPSKVDESGGNDGEPLLTTFEFEPDPAGPICLRGSPFRFGYRDVGSEDLFIYLQGGGACWSGLCSANEKAGAGVPPFAWTDPNLEKNPLATYNTAHIAYCDGSVFSGDNIVDSPRDGLRYHRGVANFTAALDALFERQPAPRHIVLSGSSAGGYGTIIGTALVRLYWPDTPLQVVNDAGLGLTNPESPETLEAIKTDWKFDQFLPASCDECRDGQFSALMSWALEHDPSLRIGVFSSYMDAVIGAAFLQMGGPEFKQLILAETGRIHERHPDRFKRYLIEGAGHTAAIGYFDIEVNGVKFIDWTKYLYADDPGWVDVLENGGK